MFPNEGDYSFATVPHAFLVSGDARGAVIERLHHLAFVERHPFAVRTVESIVTDRVSAFLFHKFRSGPELGRVERHVEHPGALALLVREAQSRSGDESGDGS